MAFVGSSVEAAAGVPRPRLNAEGSLHVGHRRALVQEHDAGKVFPRRGMLNFRELETSAGIGLRFNARNATFMRFDAAFGPEGFQLWIKFNDIFSSRRFGTSTGQPVY